MIQIAIRRLLDDKPFNERRRITLNEVAEKTKISRTTLNRIANIPGYNTNTDTIDALCNYFGCEIKDLLERVELE